MKDLDDNKIVELYLLRYEAAIKHTSEKFGKRLRSLAYGITNDLQTAEECENDTYMEAWNTIPPHEPTSYLYAFLARITRHISLNCCRECSRLKRSAFICELSAEMEECIPAPDEMLYISEDTMAMGYEGYMAYDASELVNANPWREDMGLTTMPVYQNTLDYDDYFVASGVDFEKMQEGAGRRTFVKGKLPHHCPL